MRKRIPVIKINMIILALGLMYLLLITWVSPKIHRNVLFSRICFITCLSYFFLLYLTICSLNGSIVLYDGLTQLNYTTILNEMYIILMVSIILIFTSLERAEIYFIILTSLIGVVNMVSSNDLLVSMLSLQLINLAFYFLLSINKNSEAALSAGLKYLLLSAFTTSLFLLSIVIIYSNCGSLTFDNLFMASKYLDLTWPMFFFLTSVFFKLGLAPFHNWVPDVYEGSPSIITLWLATVPKVTMLAFIINIYPLIPSQLLENFVSLVAVFSLIIGSIGLGAQLKIKRFLAYSAISHMGYIALAILVLNFYSATYYYIIYSLTTINVFAMIISISPKKDLSWLSQLSGLYLLNPALAVCLGASFLSLAGIPPLAGFFSKVWVLFALIKENLIILSVVAILTSTLSTAYYLKMVKIIFLDTPQIKQELSISSNYALVISILTLFTVLFLLKPISLLNLAILFSNVSGLA